MDLLLFIATVILVSLSGVLMPGPVFATALAEGRKNKHAGLYIASGHAAIEVPIIIALFFFGKIDIGNVKSIIGLLGGIFLLYLAFSSLKEKDEEKTVKGFIAGFALSSLNPYFLMWWLTIGFTLAIKANSFGILGLVSLIIFHELCDYSWYEFISLFSYHGAKFDVVKEITKVISFILLIFFGIYFVYDALSPIFS